MKNYVQEGDVLDLVISGGCSSGDPVLVGGISGVATLDIGAGGTGAIAVEGVFNLSVKGVDDSGNIAVAVGDPLYFVAADTPKLSKKASGKLFGWALAAVTSGATATIAVLLEDGLSPSDLKAGRVPIVLKSEVADYAATNQTTDGTTYAVPASLLKAGRTLRITVLGTSAGANASKSVKLYIDDAVIVTAAFLASAIGNFRVVFEIMEYTDLAHQLVSSHGAMATNAGATTSIALDLATDTTDFTGAKSIKTQVTSGNGGDTITQKACIIELLP